MTRRMHLRGLMAIVALTLGFAAIGTAWGQGPPVTTGAPCKNTATVNVETNDLGVSATWTISVVPGEGTETDPTAGHHTAGGSIKITVAVTASVNGGAAITQTLTLRDTYNFNGKTVTAPNTMTKSGKNGIGKNALRSRWAQAAGNVHPNNVQLQDPSNDTFTVTLTVTHSAGPQFNPWETGTPQTQTATEVQTLPAASNEQHQISINLVAGQ